MAEILSYDFMRNALLGGLLVSIVCGVVGSLVVINRMSFIAGGIAHGAYGGIGIALFLGISPVLGASVFALFLGLLIAYVTLRNTERFDAVIGAILAINHENLIFIGICGAAFAALTACFYRQFLAISFDKEFALLRGVNTSVFYYVLVVMASLAVVASIQIVGLILVISLMTIPPFIAEKISKSLGSMMAISCALSALFCAAGLVLSFKLNLTSGASIILVASVCFFASSIFSKLRA